MTHAVHVEYCLSITEAPNEPLTTKTSEVKIALVTFSDGSAKELPVEVGKRLEREIDSRRLKENSIFFLSDTKAVDLNHVVSFSSVPNWEFKDLLDCKIETTQGKVEITLLPEVHQKLLDQLKLRATDE